MKEARGMALSASKDLPTHGQGFGIQNAKNFGAHRI